MSGHSVTYRTCTFTHSVNGQKGRRMISVCPFCHSTIRTYSTNVREVCTLCPNLRPSSIPCVPLCPVCILQLHSFLYSIRLVVSALHIGISAGRYLGISLGRHLA